MVHSSLSLKLSSLFCIRPDATRAFGASAVFTGRLGYRGYSSVARAVALQAIGLGFKSPYLQTIVEYRDG